MKSLVLGLAVLASAGTAQAAPQRAGSATYIPAPPPPAGLVTIYDNIARKYPKGYFNTVAARSITGPNNGIGLSERWVGVAFTPATNYTFKRLEIAASWGGVGTNAASVALYDDNAGVPGNLLKAWSVTGMQNYGDCCSLVVKKSPGIPLTGGHQYWVVIKTDNASHNSYVVWNYNTADQITPQTAADYCENSNGITCSGSSGTWSPTVFAPGLGFAVYGN